MPEPTSCLGNLPPHLKPAVFCNRCNASMPSAGYCPRCGRPEFRVVKGLVSWWEQFEVEAGRKTA